MKQIAEYIVAMVFSVFFLIDGASFTLSHYCCNKCKTMHNAQCTMHNTLSKHCECCWVLHFEVDTTETTPAFCLPDRAENDLFGLFYPPAIHLVSTLLSLNETSHVYPPPLATNTDHTKGVLRRVCRWLI